MRKDKIIKMMFCFNCDEKFYTKNNSKNWCKEIGRSVK